MKDNFISEIYSSFVANKRKIFNKAIILVVICPVAVWLLYLFGKFIWGFPTDISADGMLGYFAAILSSIATIFLGFITLALSNRANKINNDLLGLQKDQFLLETRPFIMITNWKPFGKSYNEIVFAPDKIYLCIDNLDENAHEVSCLSLFITNTTKSFLQASYGSGSYISNGIEHRFALGAANQYNTKLLLGPGETREIVLYASVGFFNTIIGENITFEFILENHIAERYLEHAVVNITMFSDPFEQGLGDWYAMLDIQNYTVERVQNN